MHPVNNTNFGATGIAVQFTDGTAVVTGTIIEQVGTSTFMVTDAAGTVAKARLARTLADVAALPAGRCTITVTAPDGTTQHVRSIYSVTLSTVEGNRYSWTLTPGTGGAHGTMVLANIFKS